MKNKVALLIKSKKFEIETHKIDKLEKDYVLVKIHKTGVCGSDLHYFNHGGLGSFKSKMPTKHLYKYKHMYNRKFVHK